MGYIIGSQVFCDVRTDLDTCIDAHSYTICKELELLDCICDDNDLVVSNGLILCDCDDSWNCRLCSNDLPYFNPVNAGDLLYFQFQQPDNLNGQDPETSPVYGWQNDTPLQVFAKWSIVDCCTDKVLEVDFDVVAGSFVGLFEESQYNGESTFTNIQQIAFNVNAIIEQAFGGDFTEPHCFYFKFEFANGNDPDLPAFQEFCSEPYTFNNCNQKTVFLEGVNQTGRDCFGLWYSGNVWAVGNYFPYSNNYRVRGVLESLSITIQKETVTDQLKAVRSTKCKDYTLNTWGVPEEVADLIGEIMNAREIYADGVKYQINGALDRNNDTGLQWFLEIALRRCECSQDYSCNDRNKIVFGLTP